MPTQSSLRAIYRGTIWWWSRLPIRHKALVKSNAIMWAQIAWVNGLRAWDMIEHSRRSQLGFAIGVVLSTTAVAIYGLRLARLALKLSATSLVGRQEHGNAYQA